MKSLWVAICVKAPYFDFAIKLVEIVEVPDHKVYLVHLEDCNYSKIVRGDTTKVRWIPTWSSQNFEQKFKQEYSMDQQLSRNGATVFALSKLSHAFHYQIHPLRFVYRRVATLPGLRRRSDRSNQRGVDLSYHPNRPGQELLFPGTTRIRLRPMTMDFMRSGIFGIPCDGI